MSAMEKTQAPPSASSVGVGHLAHTPASPGRVSEISTKALGSEKGQMEAP
jgi:hypothetical protein